MTLFTGTSGMPDLREKVSQLLDFATQAIDQTNLGNKDLYQAVSSTPISGGRSNKADKELNKKFNNSDKEIAKLKREVERLTKS